MRSNFTIGIDLGGTHVRGGRVAADGGLEGFLNRSSRAAESADAPLEAIVDLVRDLGGREATPIGVGTPGMVDPATGSLVGSTPHLPHWRDFPLRERLETRLLAPVRLDNDANLAALAEQRCGAGRGARALVMVTVGTGVGCGLVLEGRIVRGAGGGAGEIGHLPLGGDLPCRCGVEGCVEPEMSGSGLARRAQALGLEHRDASAVFAAAARGEVAAVELALRFTERLGQTLSVAVNLLNPDVVVVGGGVGMIGETLLAPVRVALERFTLESHRRGLRVVPAALGERAGVVGAGLLAWETDVSGPRVAG